MALLCKRASLAEPIPQQPLVKLDLGAFLRRLLVYAMPYITEPAPSIPPMHTMAPGRARLRKGGSEQGPPRTSME